MKKIIILFLLFLPGLVNAQQTQYDSLKQVLNTAGADSTKYFICIELVSRYTENNRDSALFYADKALLIARQNKKYLEEASTLDSKGYALMHLGMLSESFNCFKQAFKIAEDPANENTTWRKSINKTAARHYRLNVLANIHHNIGHLYKRTENTDKAIFHYKQTRRIAEELKDTAMLGFVNMNMGHVYNNLNKLDSALVMEDNAERYFIQSGSRRYLSAVYNLKAAIYEKKGDHKNAIDYYQKAMLSAKEQNNLSSLSNTYYRLTEHYLMEEKNKDSTLYYARLNLELRTKMGLKDMGPAYALLYRSYQQNNNTDSAYKYQGLALLANDSSFNKRIKSLSDFQNLSFDEQFRLQELEKEKIETESKIRTFGFLGGLGLLSLLGLILYRNNRQKHRANVVLATTLTNLKSTQAQLIQSEKMASLGELTAGIAHEIQNPLNFVNNFSEVSNELIDEMQEELEKGDVKEAKAISADIKQNLEKIAHHGKRADAIVKGMLAHSRSGKGEKAPTDINALAEEYLKLSYHGLRARDKGFNADFKTNFDPNLPKVNVVPQDIGRVLLNLINNAFQACTGKDLTSFKNLSDLAPLVTVTTRNLGNKIEISVSDNGPGIPEAIKDKIFQPFFTTKPTGQGTGLGLSLSYDIVKAHGGELKVETTEGEGSKFTIQLLNTI